VRRHEQFEQLAAIEPQAVYHAAAIVGLLTRAGAAVGLADGSRLTLLTLVELVHSDRWRAGEPTLWTSNATIAEARGVEVRTIQRHLSDLEARGWLVRRYTRSHHRAGQGCIDLSPLTHRLAELREAVAEAEAARKLRRSEDRETARAGDKSGGDDSSVILYTELHPQNLSIRKVAALQEGVAGSVAASSVPPVSGSTEKTLTPAPETLEQAKSLIKSALAAAEADPDGYLQHYPTDNEGELATAVAALAKRRGVAASWIDAAYPRHGRLGVAARLVAALTLPGAKSIPGLARWMLSTDHRVDPWASIYARARS
jgi:DNA-binding MarR family transcriptional regulator